MSIEPTQRQDRYRLLKAGYAPAEACERCGSTDNLVIDHIIELSQGGNNDPSNLRTLCQSCNTKQSWQHRARSDTEKYTTHLYHSTIKTIKKYAFEHDMKDYEVVQRALVEFFEHHKEEHSK